MVKWGWGLWKFCACSYLLILFARHPYHQTTPPFPYFLSYTSQPHHNHSQPPTIFNTISLSPTPTNYSSPPTSNTHSSISYTFISYNSSSHHVIPPTLLSPTSFQWTACMLLMTWIVLTRSHHLLSLSLWVDSLLFRLTSWNCFRKILFLVFRSKSMTLIELFSAFVSITACVMTHFKTLFHKPSVPNEKVKT